MLASRRGVIGTRLLNLNGADSDHPEPMVQDIWPGGTGGDLFCSARDVNAASLLDGLVGRIAATDDGNFFACARSRRGVMKVRRRW